MWFDGDGLDHNHDRDIQVDSALILCNCARSYLWYAATVNPSIAERMRAHASKIYTAAETIQSHLIARLEDDHLLQNVFVGSAVLGSSMLHLLVETGASRLQIRHRLEKLSLLLGVLQADFSGLVQTLTRTGAAAA